MATIDRQKIKAKTRKVVPLRGDPNQDFSHVFSSTFRGLVDVQEKETNPQQSKPNQ